MSHPDEGVLQALLDGELDQAETAGVRGHLAQCAACRDALAELEANMNEASGLVDRLVLEPPAMRPAPKALRARSRWASVGAMGIAASLLVAVGAMFVQHRPTAPLDLREGKDAGAMPDASAAADAPEAESKAGDTFRLRSGRTATAAPPAPAPAAVAPREAEKANAQAPGEDLRKSAPTEEVAVTAAHPRQDSPAPAVLRDEVVSKQRAEGMAYREVPVLEGLAADSVLERGDADGTVRSRSFYSVGETTVVLEVRRLSRGANERGLNAAGARAERRLAAPAADQAIHEYRWELRGNELVLRGALPVDSLAALATKVR